MVWGQQHTLVSAWKLCSMSTITVLIRWTFLLLCFVIFENPIQLSAQEQPTELPELYQLPDGKGWLGVDRTPSADSITSARHAL